MDDVLDPTPSCWFGRLARIVRSAGRPVDLEVSIEQGFLGAFETRGSSHGFGRLWFLFLRKMSRRRFVATCFFIVQGQGRAGLSAPHGLAFHCQIVGAIRKARTPVASESRRSSRGIHDHLGIKVKDVASAWGALCIHSRVSNWSGVTLDRTWARRSQGLT